MKCEEALDRLGADGEISNREISRSPISDRELAIHLDECAACRDHLDRIRRVVAAAGALRSPSPARDLWPGIERRIAEPAPRERPLRALWPLAASLLATIGLAWMVTSLDDDSRLETVETEQIRIANWDDVIADSERRADEILAARAAELPAESRIALEADLAEVEGAIREIRAAIHENPGYAPLEILLASRVQQHARLIQRISHV